MSGCSSCSIKKKDSNGNPTGCRNNGWCKSGGCGSILDVHDWLQNVTYGGPPEEHPIVEVRFKGTRKEFFRNNARLDVMTGDLVVVESATQGYDVGQISLSGELVRHQMKKYGVDPESPQMRRLVRRCTESDLQRYEEAKDLEHPTMMRARNIALHLGLVMKISDVEYQGDKTKATFFYTAEGRVDFRELIKQYAREFRVKVEMRQIGLRQEAGRLGGIGSCGRELCCSTWLTDFASVGTTAARYQNLFLNPLKLSGQCGRLKCCLNYELDNYIEALAEFPDENIVLMTEKGKARVEKMDILKRIVWFKFVDEPQPRLFPVELHKVREIMEMNRQGVTITDLDEFQYEAEVAEEDVELKFMDAEGEDRIDRFERGRRKGAKGKGKGQQPQRPQGKAPQAPASRPRCSARPSGAAQAEGRATPAGRPSAPRRAASQR